MDFYYICQVTMILEDWKKQPHSPNFFLGQDREEKKKKKRKKHLITASKILMPVTYVTQSSIAVSIRNADLISKARVWEKGIDLTSKSTRHIRKDINTFVYKLHIQLEMVKICKCQLENYEAVWWCLEKVNAILRDIRWDISQSQGQILIELYKTPVGPHLKYGTQF